MMNRIFLMYYTNFFFQNIKDGRRTKGICECYPSSTSSHSDWIQPRNLGEFGIVDNQLQQLKHAGTQINYKSEEDDITGEGLDSLASPDGSGEAILAETVQETKPWWELPKRWVIVLLCFTAFLLCNMDRVSFFFLFKLFKTLAVFINSQILACGVSASTFF